MVSLWGMALFSHSLIGVVGALLFFFLAFNILEASLPSLVAKMSPADKKGTAMGVYSSSQFLGAFMGGISGGWIYQHVGGEGVLYFCAMVAGVWVVLAATMRNPRYLTSHMINVGQVTEAEAKHLVVQMTQITGVAEAIVIPEDGVAYLKVDKHALEEEALAKFSINENGESAQNTSPANTSALV
jgi:MFS family permease